MELFTIDAKPFKQIFLQTLIPMLAVVLGSFLLINNGYIIWENFDRKGWLTWPIMTFMIFLAFSYSYYRKKRIAKILVLDDFDNQVKEYEKIYKLTMRWYLLSCLVSCFLAVLTARNIFLIFAGYDFVMALPFYPTQSLFKKELVNDELLVHR